MIKISIKKLTETWIENEYDLEAIDNEWNRINNALWALYENGIITKECMITEGMKLDKAHDKAVSRKELQV